MRAIAALFSVSLLAQAPVVEEGPLRAHLAFLADDLVEGRGTGQRGGDLAVRYLETQLRALGLRPANGTSYLQEVSIRGIRTFWERSELAFEGGKERLVPAVEKDLVGGIGVGKEELVLDAPVVFAGYGIQAAEEGWDDFKGQDLRGRILVMLVNDPPPTAEEPNRFGGKAMTYYGRWTYKLEQAARLGAAGVLLIHTDASATYGWSVVRTSWVAERFYPSRNPAENPFQGWITEAFARRLFAAAGKDLGNLREAAGRKDFRPVDLGLRLSGRLRGQVRELPQYNVAGVIPGSDPALKDEAVIFSAHWDHFGVEPGPPLRIYNGAVDNASGCAGLLAMAQIAVRRPAPRTLMFLFVCGEEQGLLGSEAYVRAPLWPLERTVADLNLDSMNWVGATGDISLFGAERTTLYDTGVEVAARMGLKVSPAGPDTTGGYFRSDHFWFAKAGVPAFSVGAGQDYSKDPAGAKNRAASAGSRYHQPTDRYDPAWDLSGMVQQAQFALNLGFQVAGMPQRPVWKPGAKLPPVPPRK
ncbi:MAG: M28 family peptidase [Acidobacteria bacterium]|nr:M28 family peptidase [Acidobacteriota bacterium]